MKTVSGSLSKFAIKENIMSETVFKIKLTWFQRLRLIWDGVIEVTVENPPHIETQFMGVK